MTYTITHPPTDSNLYSQSAFNSLLRNEMDQWKTIIESDHFFVLYENCMLFLRILVGLNYKKAETYCLE